MYSIISSTTFIVFSYYISSIAAASLECFQQQGDSFTIPSPDSTRVSVGVTCLESHCDLRPAGFVNANSTLNVTLPAPAEIFVAVGRANNITFPQSVYGAVSDRNLFIIGENQSAFVAFTITYQCFDGFMTDCAREKPNVVAIGACRPLLTSEHDLQGVPIFEGNLSLVKTTSSNVANMSTNPAQDERNMTASPGTVSPGTKSWAAKLEQERIWSLTTVTIMGLTVWLAL